MVMWMSRVERKKIEKKSNKYFKLYLVLQIILLICALIFVDFQIRGMLGTYESRLIGYDRIENQQYNIHVMGNSYLIDISILQSNLDNIFADFQEIAYNIKDWLENKLQKIVQ